MTTTKDRINISVSTATHKALKSLAKRDQEPVATKALALIELALEIEEDSVANTIATKRDTKGVRWIKDSDAIWT